MSSNKKSQRSGNTHKHPPGKNCVLQRAYPRACIESHTLRVQRIVGKDEIVNIKLISNSSLSVSSPPIPPLSAGLGPQAEEHPREDGYLDLGGRECLACTVSDTLEGGAGCAGGGGGGEGGSSSGRKRRSGVAAAIAAASAAAGRRGRSELYLVLDAKAFLLATPDRCVCAYSTAFL